MTLDKEISKETSVGHKILELFEKEKITKQEAIVATMTILSHLLSDKSMDKKEQYLKILWDSITLSAEEMREFLRKAKDTTVKA